MVSSFIYNTYRWIKLSQTGGSRGKHNTFSQMQSITVYFTWKGKHKKSVSSSAVLFLHVGIYLSLTARSGFGTWALWLVLWTRPLSMCICTHTHMNTGHMRLRSCIYEYPELVPCVYRHMQRSSKWFHELSLEMLKLRFLPWCICVHPKWVSCCCHGDVYYSTMSYTYVHDARCTFCNSCNHGNTHGALCMHNTHTHLS